MAVFLVVAAVAAAGLAGLLQQFRRGAGSPLFVLSALPLALLFLIAPVPLAAVQATRAFQDIGAAGEGNVRTAAVLAMVIVRPIWFGSGGCLLVIGISAALQRRVLRADGVALVATPVRSWGNAVLAATSLLALPVGLLTYLTWRIGPLILLAGQALTSPTAAATTTVAGMDLQSFSAMMSMRLILAAVGGLTLLALTLVAVVTSFPAARVSSPTPALLKYSWAVGVTVGVATLANLVAATMSLMASGRVFDAAVAGR